MLTLTVLAATAVSACSTAGYYGQLMRGQYAILAGREPIERLVADPATDAALRQRLQLALKARAFAVAHLALPQNGSYTVYTDVHRPYVVWNVFATPELSLKPVTHCFPIAGCVAYRGYFDQASAREEAVRLHAQGDDAYVGGVSAYSTLGWFDDPVLSTMLRWDDDELHGTIFHELAHQKLYVKGDTAFNESFASFVQREGLKQWHLERGLPPADEAHQQRDAQFTQLVLAARARLEAVYTSGLPADTMRARKQEEIERLRADYRQLRDTQWHGEAGYDAWMNAEINNAKLLPFGLYDQWVPAFSAIYARKPGDWPAFYAAVKQFANKAPDARHHDLQQLVPGSTS